MSVAAPSPGWRQAALPLLGSLLDIGHTRLALATVELEEQRLSLARLCIAALSTLALLFIGLLLAAGAIVLWCEPAQRLLALGVLSAMFLLAAAAAAWRWQRLQQGRPVLLHASLAELRNDRGALPEALVP